MYVELEKLDEISIETKQTSLHVVRNGVDFLGIHPRKDGIRINIVLNYCPDSDRISKSEQVSKSRFHNEVDLTSEVRIDEQLTAWIHEAYELKV